MKVLVAGADSVDAGKTTFSVGLLDRTGAVGYKPRAGNDYWYHHDDYERAVDAGRLYGKDARRLAAAGGADVEPEDINPLHRLWRPSPGSTTGILGDADREFVIDRAGETFVVNETVTVPESARENLPLEDAISVASLGEFNDVMARHHLQVQEALSTEIASTDRAVIESYGDVARPLGDLAADAVAVVEPGRARMFDGDRYLKACEVATGGPGDGTLEEQVAEVIGLAEPKADVSLPALTANERTDPATVAQAYEHAYDALLAVAFD